MVTQELQEIVKGRGGSGSLLDQLKKPSNAVQKGIIAPLTGSPQSSAFEKAPAAAAKAGGAHCLHRLSALIFYLRNSPDDSCDRVAFTRLWSLHFQVCNTEPDRAPAQVDLA